MIIALDYDGTYTKLPGTFGGLVRELQELGVTVIIVTLRKTKPDIIPGELAHLPWFCTGYQAKEQYMFDLGIKVNIWIDDCPWTICHDYVEPK